MHNIKLKKLDYKRGIAMTRGIEAAIEALGGKIKDLESANSWKQSQLDACEQALKKKDETIETLKRTVCDLGEQIARESYPVPMEKKAGLKP